MRRYFVVSIVLGLAITSLFSSFAFGANGAVVSYDDVDLLEVTPQAGHEGNPYDWPAGRLGPGNKDGTAVLEANGESLVFDFSRGLGPSGPGGQSFGLQPNTSYTWYNLFRVINLLDDRQTKALVELNFDLPDGLEIQIRENGTGTWVSSAGDGELVKVLAEANDDYTDQADELYIDVRLVVGATVGPGTIVYEGEIDVSAEYPGDPGEEPEYPPGPRPPAADPDPNRIRVQVTKDDGGEVEGLQVRITGPVNATIFTDDTGAAAVRGLPNGTYNVAVQAAGYASDGPNLVQLTGFPVEISTQITLTAIETEPPEDLTPIDEPADPPAEPPEEKPIDDPADPPGGPGEADEPGGEGMIDDPADPPGGPGEADEPGGEGMIDDPADPPGGPGEADEGTIDDPATAPDDGQQGNLIETGNASVSIAVTALSGLGLLIAGGVVKRWRNGKSGKRRDKR